MLSILSILVWPVVAVVVALVVIFQFKKPLERLVDRISKITPKGVEATAASQETAIEKKGAEELLAQIERTPLLAEREDIIRRELDFRRIDSPAERERVLLRHLAAAYLYSYFTNCHQAIFGSQLSLLRDLNASSPMKKGTARTYYDLAVVMSPDFYDGSNFDQWLNFLAGRTLVRVDGDDLNITVAGREFLKFMIQEGLTFNKGS